MKHALAQINPLKIEYIAKNTSAAKTGVIFSIGQRPKGKQFKSID